MSMAQIYQLRPVGTQTNGSRFEPFSNVQCRLKICFMQMHVRKTSAEFRPPCRGANDLTHWGRDKNGRNFADDIFKCILLNENAWIPIKISQFVHQCPINNIPVLVQIMAWRRPGDKSLSGPMMVRLPTYICVTRLQWVNTLWPE